MNEKEAIELGRRWMACCQFEWITGMRDICGNIYVGHNEFGNRLWVRPDTHEVVEQTEEVTDDWSIVDPRDPATIGCIIPMLRLSRAMGVEIELVQGPACNIFECISGMRLSVEDHTDSPLTTATFAEAAIAALVRSQ